jgi:predicted lipoprotein
MLQDLTEIVIVPGYDRAVVEADQLAAAAAQLDSAPDAGTLAATQAAWREARSAWKQTEAFAIGPAETLRSHAAIDWSPIRADRIEAVIGGTSELTAAYVGGLGANQKGFLALEYLLFDANGDDAAALQSLVGEPRRRGLVRALAENLRDEAAELRDAWAPDAGNYAAVLGGAGPGNPTYPTVKSAVDKMVNQLVFLSEDIADTQLLAALGTRTGGVPRPEALDAHRSQNGLADLLDNLAGIQNVYFDDYSGRRGESLSAIVENLSPPAAGTLALAIRRAFETATRISHPLEEAVSTETELVERAQVRAKELMGRLEIDLVSVLGTTLRFNPSDGD